jgi:hypothetical protein
MGAAASSATATKASRFWESRSQQLLTAGFVAAGATMLFLKSGDAPARRDPLAELHAPPPADPQSHPTARIAAMVGADPTDPEKDTVFDNKRIAAGPVGDLLPAGRRARAREAAESAGVDIGKDEESSVKERG